MNNIAEIADKYRGYTAAEIDAGAEALRNHQMSGRVMRPWKNLPNSSKRKWLISSERVLMAAATARIKGAS